MTLPAFNDTGLAPDANVRKAYDLARDVTEKLSPAHEAYLAMTLAVTRTLQALPDADDAAKVRWSVIALASVAGEFSGARQNEIKPQVDALLTDAGANYNGEYNFDDPNTDLAGVPADLKVIVAAGIAHSVDAAKSLQDPDILQAMKERFNRHASGIAPADIPASLHRQMSDALTQINAFTIS